MNTTYLLLSVIALVIIGIFVIKKVLKKNKRAIESVTGQVKKEEQIISPSGKIFTPKDTHYTRVPARDVPEKGEYRKHKGDFFARKKKKR